MMGRGPARGGALDRLERPQQSGAGAADLAWAVAEVRTRIPTIQVSVALDTTKTAGRGTGLGLFVVRHIVESAGGP